MVKHELALPEDEWVKEGVCFHCQQAVEKHLKAFLVSRDIEVAKTHNISYLLVKCREISPQFPEFQIRDLSLFGVAIRYPDDLYVPTVEETRYYANLAHEIAKYIQELLSRLQKGG